MIISLIIIIYYCFCKNYHQKISKFIKMVKNYLKFRVADLVLYVKTLLASKALPSR